MKKSIFIVFVIIYSVSFTPIPEEIKVGNEYITLNQIYSNFGAQELHGNFVGDFFGSLSNTIIFDIPANYGSFIKLFNEQKGNRMILNTFSNRNKKPVNPTAGWSIGLVLGWILRIGVVLLVYLKTWKHNN